MGDGESIDETTWTAQVEHVAAALEIDASGVPPYAVHDLASQVTVRYQRPMAPVSTYLWGLVIVTHPDHDPGELARVILNALPKS